MIVAVDVIEEQFDASILLQLFIFDLYYPQRYYQDILQNEITFVERPYGIGPHDIMSQGGTYYPQCPGSFNENDDMLF